MTTEPLRFKDTLALPHGALVGSRVSPTNAAHVARSMACGMVDGTPMLAR